MPTGGTGAADVLDAVASSCFLTGAAPAAVRHRWASLPARRWCSSPLSVSTSSPPRAEEVKNPQKTLPRGIFGGLAIVTVLYILVSLALTGMVSYKDLAEAENPSLATAFDAVGANWAAQVISVGILIGLTTVIMVLLMGLSRVVPSR